MESNKEVVLKMSAQEVGIVLTALAELPLKQSGMLFSSIQKQFAEQDIPPPEIKE